MTTEDLPGDVSDDSWDTGHPALPMNYVPTVPRNFPQYTRPFEPWSDIARDYPGHLEVVRFLRQLEQDRAFMCTRRRSHAPSDKAITREWGLDAIYMRHEGERAYFERLCNIQVQTAPPRLSPELICVSEPCIPHMSLPPQTPCPPTYANFPPGGDLPNPAGSGAATDSPWALRELAIAGISGDPGRLISETRKEYRDTRKYGFMVPLQQAELYAQSGDARDALYVRCPKWWEESWTSPLMMVPIPSVVTYRASMLLSEKEGTFECDFWWRVLEVEWVVLVFGRWCVDIQERTIMWRLPVRESRGLDELKVENLFHRSPYNVQSVPWWMQDHDAHNWEASHMLHRVRGPSKGEAPLVEERPTLYAHTTVSYPLLGCRVFRSWFHGR
jgi:hypothetical protein